MYIQGRTIKQAMFSLPPLDIYLNNVKDLILLNQQWAFDQVKSNNVNLYPFDDSDIHLGLSGINGNAHAIFLNARLLNSVSEGNLKLEEIELRVVIAASKRDVDDAFEAATRYLAGIQLILETVMHTAPQELIAGWSGPTPKLLFNKLSGDAIAPDLPAIAIAQGVLPRLILNLTARATLNR